MKSHEQNLPELLDQFFGRYRRLPSMRPDLAWEQVIYCFRKDPSGVHDESVDSNLMPRTVAKPRSVWLAAAAIVSLAVALSLAFPFQDLREVPGAFEVASIRPVDPLNQPPPSCGRFRIRIDPRRFVASNASLCSLISLAYGDRDLAPVAPSVQERWMRSERFEIEATIPEGTPPYTSQEVMDHQAPAIQRMLQALLTERFQVVVEREPKEMPVYNLVVVREGKLSPADLGREAHQLAVPSFHASEISMKGLALVLQDILQRPVIDKTNLLGSFDVLLEFRPLLSTQAPDQSDAPMDPIETLPLVGIDELRWQLQEQLGLKLESGSATVDVLVVRRAERATPN